MTKNYFFSKFVLWSLVATVCLHVSIGHATGVLDSVDQTIQAASTSWMGTALGYANTLFFGLAGLEFTWSAIQLTLKKNDLPDIIVGTLFKVMSLAFFAMILNEAPTWIPMIINSFTQAGTAVAGGGTPLTPSGVIDQGISLASNIITQGMNVNGTQNGGVVSAITSGGVSMGKYMLSAIVIGLTGIMIVLAFAVIALQLFVTLVESYLVVGGGALMLGFLGSRWTSNFGEKYFGYAISVGIKLFTLYLIIGFGSDLVTQMQAQLSALTAGGNSVGLGDWLGMGGTSVVYGGVGYMVPGLASSMMNGSPSMTMSNLGAAGGAMAAAPVAVGLATGAAGAQAAGLVGKTFGSTQTAAVGGISGSPTSGGGFAGSVTGGTAALSRLTQGTGKTTGGATSATEGTGQTGGNSTQTTNAASKGAQTASRAPMSAPVNKSEGIAPQNTGGNGFTNAPVSGGVQTQNATGGMSASDSGTAGAQKDFESSQKPNRDKTLSEKLLDKSDDLQRAADRHKPNLVHDGSSGSGISIRLNHDV